jgi:hypothetical protein
MMKWGANTGTPYGDNTMSVRQRRYPKDEFARRGNEIYDRDIRPQVEAGNQGKIVVIDIDSGGWEMDADEMAAAARLEARCPEAQIWMVRVGSPYVRRFGAERVRPRA